MSTPLGSLGSRLPYWTTLSLPLKPHAWGNGPLSVLVLKDGTMALGLRVHGIDAYSDDNSALNEQSAAVAAALKTLPDGCYLQSCFESGYSHDKILADFATQGDDASHPVLRRGRKLMHDTLKDMSWVTRCEITYYIGWTRALSFVTQGKYARLKHSQEGEAAEKIQRAGQVLLDVANQFDMALSGAGITTELMQERDLLQACHRALNPTSHRHFAPPNFCETPEDLADYKAQAPLVLRGPSLSSQLPLASVIWDRAHLTLGEPPILARVLDVKRLSDATTPRSLHHVLFDHMPDKPYRLVVTHRATSRQLSAEKLKRRRTFAFGLLGGALMDHDARQSFESHDSIIAQLAQGDTALFQTTVTALVFGDSEHALDAATRDIYNGFMAQNIASSVMLEEQLQGWLASLPANGHVAPYPVTLLDRNCAHLTPYWLPSTGDKSPDLLFITRQRSLEALSVRLSAERENAGAIVLGSTGSGKTFFFSALLKYGCLNKGGHAIVVDVKGPQNSSYRPLCALLGGQYISLQDDAEACFNPFATKREVFGHSGAISDAALDSSVVALCLMSMPVYDGNIDMDFWTDVARRALKRAYAAIEREDMPLIVDDVIAALGKMETQGAKDKVIIAEMAQRLEAFVSHASRARLFNTRISVDLSNPFTVFDFAGMEQDSKASMVLLAALTSRIDAKMRGLPKTMPKLFGFDEAWKLLEGSEAGCTLLGMLYRTARSYGAFCYVISQHEDDITRSAVGQAILSNSSLRYLLRRNDGHDAVAKAFGLSPRQASLFKSLKPVPDAFAEILLIDTLKARTHVLQYWATAFDRWCDTSRPADVEFRQQRIAQTGRSLVEVIDELAQRFPNGAPNVVKEKAS